MLQVPERRLFTTPTNLIDWRAVRRVATGLRRKNPDWPASIGPVRRGTSIRGCLTEALARARAEQEARQGDLFAVAADVVDGAILVLHRGDPSAADSLTRRRAIVALAAGRAAFLPSGGCSDQLALSACAAVNTGAVSLARFIGLTAEATGRPPTAYASMLIDALCPVNERASYMLHEVRRAAAGGSVGVAA
ncbi:hypothetical protein [Methylovirgula sp. 4M-Z18]|uniref:hypothetical protein n=1 Tax=Methylovirgula sp. 4M-Z18 TaxID=2293567 RepID=UPI000E2F64A0|nr:hypothetical protein [Methylovirgula sp. 4M-Z18]